MVCDSGKWPPLEGMVVVVTRSSHLCSFDSTYRELMKAKAAAFIETAYFNPPDILISRRGTWFGCPFCQSSMSAIRVLDPEDELFGLRNKGKTILLEIRPPHESSIQDTCKSPLWFIVMRIFFPGYAFWTAAIAAFEVYRELISDKFKKTAEISVRMFICALEAPAMFITGLALALDIFGTTPVVPSQVAYVLFGFFTGVSTFTTVLLAIYLREESRHLRAGPGRPRLSIWKTNYRFIAAAFVAFIGHDLVLLTRNVVENFYATAYLVLVFPTSLSVAVLFCHQVGWYSAFFVWSDIVHALLCHLTGMI